MQETGTAVWSASSVRDSDKSLPEKGLVAVHVVSKAFVQEGSDLWNPCPGGTWSKSKLQLSCSCGSGLLCATDKSVILSVAFVAFLYYFCASQSILSTQLSLLESKRRFGGLFPIYLHVTDFKANS